MRFSLLYLFKDFFNGLAVQVVKYCTVGKLPYQKILHKNCIYSCWFHTQESQKTPTLGEPIDGPVRRGAENI
jgi:hypothetical protein